MLQARPHSPRLTRGESGFHVREPCIGAWEIPIITGSIVSVQGRSQHVVEHIPVLFRIQWRDTQFISKRTRRHAAKNVRQSKNTFNMVRTVVI